MHIILNQIGYLIFFKMKHHQCFLSMTISGSLVAKKSSLGTAVSLTVFQLCQKRKCLGIALISVYFLPSPFERKINGAELLALCP